MTIITGVAGFIGAHVALALLKQGKEVVGIDNISDIYDVALKKYRIGLLQEYSSFTFYEKDVSQKKDIEVIFSIHPPDTIIHLASRAGVRNSFVNPEEYVLNNVLSTNYILDILSDKQACKIVLASSSSVYAQRQSSGARLGRNTVSPFKEDMYTNTPYSPYASSKIAAEVLSSSYFHHFDNFKSMVNLRFFTVYGQFGRPDMSIFKFIQKIINNQPLSIYGDGSQKRAFTYIDDIVNGILEAVDIEGYRVLNLGNDQSHSVLNLISLIEKHLGKRAIMEFGDENVLDIEATLPDLEAVRSALSWSPKISLNEGIKRTVEWHKAHVDFANTIAI